MIDHSPFVAFDRPAWLALAAALPLVWWWRRDLLRELGRVRGSIVLVLRSLVWLLLVAACAEMQWVRTDDRLTVIYLLDRSQSVPQPQRRVMIDYVNRSIAARRDGDWFGVVAFGREARTELPPQIEPVRLSQDASATIDPRYTNLAGALRLAQASFPADSARRIVIVSDGNANLGDAYGETRRAVDQGIGVDVVPIPFRAQGEVLVEKVTLPTVARRGEPLDVQILVNNATPAGNESASTSGTLELVRKQGARTTTLSKQRVDLPPGRRSYQVRQTLDDADFYEFEATFTPDDPQADALAGNNRASGFTQLEGAGRVLVIENFRQPGRHARLIDALRREKLEVVTMPSNRLFQSPAELIAFDTVVLADVPRSGGVAADEVAAFGDDQVRMLAANVHDMGAGLVMLGGPNSFGAGGWAHSQVETAMPVDFQIDNVQVVAGGALALVIDGSGSMLGPKLDMSRRAAVAAVRVLGGKDEVGVVAFDSAPHWLVPLGPIGSLPDVIDRIGRISAGGGTDMRPALEEAYAALKNSKASIKHLIALTDGLTQGDGFERMAGEMKQLGITTTTVAIGADSNGLLLDGMARQGGGKFYPLRRPEEIPKIFMLEALRIARPLIYERPAGFTVRREATTPKILPDFDDPLPQLKGMILTQLKPSELARPLLTNPALAADGTGTVAAAWTYGLGRTAVWTTDAGENWASAWNDWPQFDLLLTGLVRWTMRPPASSGRFAIAAEMQDGAGRVVVTAFDDDGNFLNLLNPQGTVLGPDLVARPIQLEQTAPGRYAATFAAEQVGSYFVVIRPAPGEATLRAGVNVSYSPELRDREANLSLLDSLAALKTRDGTPGLVAPAATTAGDAAAPIGDFYRRDLPEATGRRDLWPELVLAALLLFVIDVFLRRVAVDAQLLAELARRVSRRVVPQAAPAASAPLAQLRSRADSLPPRPSERRRPAPVVEAKRSPSVAADRSPAAEAEAGYTSRLRQAKRRAHDERGAIGTFRPSERPERRGDDSFPTPPQDRA